MCLFFLITRTFSFVGLQIIVKKQELAKDCKRCASQRAFITHESLEIITQEKACMLADGQQTVSWKCSLQQSAVTSNMDDMKDWIKHTSLSNAMLSLGAQCGSY